MIGGGAGDRVEDVALPAPLTGIVRNGVRDGFDQGPGKRLLWDVNADVRRGAGRWVSLAGMGVNFFRGERGGCSSLQKQRQKTSHYGRAPPQRVLAGTQISPGRENPSKFWVAGANGHRSVSGAPAQGQPHQPVTSQHPP